MSGSDLFYTMSRTDTNDKRQIKTGRWNELRSFRPSPTNVISNLVGDGVGMNFVHSPSRTGINDYCPNENGTLK